MRNAIFFSISLLAGCSASTMAPTSRVDGSLAADLLEDSTARSAWGGTPEGIGSLAFLNDISTTYEILDAAVPLDRRAAGNLIDHRDGRDERYGTKVDDRFNSIEEEAPRSQTPRPPSRWEASAKYWTARTTPTDTTCRPPPYSPTLTSSFLAATVCGLAPMIVRR
jgi:hypothetical protein